MVKKLIGIMVLIAIPGCLSVPTFNPSPLGLELAMTQENAYPFK